jgi:putative hydrolase of the HAD superfamily
MPGSSRRSPGYEVVVFDLGGVVIELAGVPEFQGWTRLAESEVWSRWLRSPAVREYESGRSSTERFAVEVVREFDLALEPAEFLRRFARWPRGLLPGARELVLEVRSRLRVACLSNSNPLHWPRFRDELGIASVFDASFSSHELGCVKPDREIFERLLRELGSPGDAVLFLDDNPQNVEGARAAGLHARCVRGPADARRALGDLGVLRSGS